MTTDAPLVSAIIPVWNGAGFLPNAIASIRAQNYAPLEILVVDDGSTDDTANVAAQMGNDVRYLGFPHRGLALTRPEGIRAARGVFLAFWMRMMCGVSRNSPANLNYSAGIRTF